MPIASIKNLAVVMEETLTAVGADIDLYMAFPRPKKTRNRARTGLVFVSHAASDASIALFLKEEFQTRISGLAVFCSSDPTDLPPGTKWSPEIQRTLERSSVLVLVASERSLKRPWVWFECGTFWFGGRRIIPLCVGGVRKDTLRAPLSELQAVNGDDPVDLRTLLETLSNAVHLPLSESLGFDVLAASLNRLDNETQAGLGGHEKR
jgi:hypothetical protein